MESAQREFAEFIEEFHFSELNFPVISNYTARPYKQEDIKRNLIEQITNSVKWTESIRYLMGQGVTVFEEIGPGNILTKLIQTIQRDEEPLTISAPEDSLFFLKGTRTIRKAGKSIASWPKI